MRNKEKCPVCDKYSVKDATRKFETIIDYKKYVVHDVPAKYCSSCKKYFFDIAILRDLNSQIEKAYRKNNADIQNNLDISILSKCFHIEGHYIN